MNPESNNSAEIPPPSFPLPRIATLEEWERGRAYRRWLSLRANNGRPLRRAEGDPRKDALLRQLYAGERGMPFTALPAAES